MKKIGFKNFRRFVEFPVLECGPITFLVGRNNSGKSTFVKAILLIDNFLKSEKIKIFDFADKILEDVNIVTFGRAKNKTNKKNNAINFVYQIEDYEVFIEITGNEDDTQAKVVSLFIKNLKNGYYYNFSTYGTGYGISTIIGKTEIQQSEYKEPPIEQMFELEINNLIYQINTSKYSKTSKEYIELTDRLNSFRGKKELLKKTKVDYERNVDVENKIRNLSDYSAEAWLDNVESIYEILEPVLSDISYNYHLSLDEVKSDDKNYKEELDYYRSFKGIYDDKFKVEKYFSIFLNVIKNQIYIYLGANSMKQMALFAIKDTLNPLAQAINEYKQLGIDLEPGSTACTFTRKWMKEFDIGDDFKIKMHAGEAYEVKIISNKIEIPLADKGMGSVQAMLLIIRIACIIEKYGQKNKTITVVIEEPELNLHPALQSKLAELFLHVNQMRTKKLVRCNIEFIIETHSEYLIRKTQLLVKENEFEIHPNENPFNVIYFDKDMKQWKMNYRADGKFIEEFGSGFYDESSLLTLNLL